MKISELNSLLRTRLMQRGVPCKAHQMKDGSFHVSVTITGSALSIDIPYIIRQGENGGVVVTTDDKVYEVKKLTTAVSVIYKEVRTQRSVLSKYTKQK